MSEMIDITAGAQERHDPVSGAVMRRRFRNEGVANLPVHSFPGRKEFTAGDTVRLRSGEAEGNKGDPQTLRRDESEPSCIHDELGRKSEPIGGENPNSREYPSKSGLSWEEERERRIHRARTVKILRQYMRYSIETGRLPSLLGREFFRAKVSPYSMVTFEDRVIFVHDMENCLNKLDGFSREILARHILQEHDQAATARFLQCTERTVRRYLPMALDLLTEILLDTGLLERTFPIRQKLVKRVKSAKSL